MTIRPSIIAAALAFSLSGCILNVNGAGMGPLDHQQTQLHLDADGLNALVAETGAGELKIQGVAGLKQITVTADIYTYDDFEVDLVLEQQGKTAHLIAQFDTHIGFTNTHRSPYIDLIVQVPADMMMDIDDGSGAISIKGISADIKLNDGSGDIEIEGGNNLTISDGSGSLDIVQVTGDIKLNDGSGGINIDNVGGNLSLDDGSGSIQVENVGGDVVVNDGSGNMYLNNIQGKVTVDDGSGDIDIFNTKGLTILEAGSGDLSFDEIDGPVSMR